MSPKKKLDRIFGDAITVLWILVFISAVIVCVVDIAKPFLNR